MFVMVTNSASLEAVANGPDGLLAGLAPGKVIIDMSTVSPAVEQGAGRQGPREGRRHGRCPGLRQHRHAAAGQALGHGRRNHSHVRRNQADSGRRRPEGDARRRQRPRARDEEIASNLSLCVQMLAFSEGVLLAEKSGISRATAVDVLTHSAIASPMVVYRGPFVLEMPAEAWFNVNMMQKDMMLALELGRQVDVPLPTTAVANEYLTAARAMGLVEDFATVFKVLASLSGVKP